MSYQPSEGIAKVFQIIDDYLGQQVTTPATTADEQGHLRHEMIEYVMEQLMLTEGVEGELQWQGPLPAQITCP